MTNHSSTYAPDPKKNNERTKTRESVTRVSSAKLYYIYSRQLSVNNRARNHLNPLSLSQP